MIELMITILILASLAITAYLWAFHLYASDIKNKSKNKTKQNGKND